MYTDSNMLMIIISMSFSISVASRALMLRTCRLAYLSVCVCLLVCAESVPVLWQNGWMDPDAVWDGEWGR